MRVLVVRPTACTLEAAFDACHRHATSFLLCSCVTCCCAEQGPKVHAACAFTLQADEKGATCPHCLMRFELYTKEEAAEAYDSEDE
jgi:hypothetical protein